MSGRSRWLVALVPLLALVAVSCSDDNDDAGANSAATSTTIDAVSGDVNVFAAASLTEALTAMGTKFEAEHPNTTVTLNFASSSALAQQINEGAPADVFVSADESNMKKVTDAGNALQPKTVARNRLAILVEKGNPKQIKGLTDLAKSDVALVMCSPEVPCGKFGAAALAKANVAPKPASLEENVKAVVSKVTLGEADAGIVYVTDVKAAGNKAQGVDIDIADDPSLEALYLAAATKTGADNEAAKAWIDYLVSDEGQATLAKFGFLEP